MSKQVDLQPIQKLYLENLLAQDSNQKICDSAAIQEIGHPRVAKVFEGTDVFLTKDGQLEQLEDGTDGQKVKIQTPLSEEAAFILMIRNADTNHDQALDIDEARKMLQTQFSKEEYEKIDPEAFLKRIDERIKNFFNYLGQHRNTYFARSVLTWLAKEPDSGDVKFQERMRQQATDVRRDMLGHGGSFGDLIAVGRSNLLCGFGAWCQPTPFRSWGEEDRMNSYGEGIAFLWNPNYFGEYNFNPFETNHDLNLSPYPALTKPAPSENGLGSPPRK